MKKTLLLLSTMAILALTGCGESYIDDSEKTPKIGYNDIINKELYSFNDVVLENDYNSTFDDYNIECDSNNGFLVDEITDKKKGYVYSTFVCVEKF